MPKSIDAETDWEFGCLDGLGELLQQPPRPPRRPPPFMVDDPRIARVIRFIERAPAEKTRLEDIADHVRLSPFHLQRTFQEVMGESPGAYMRRTRLNRSAVSLQNGDEPLVRVALDAGYSSHEAYVRGFHRQFGVVPSQYRAMAKRSLPPSSADRAASAEPVSVAELEEMSFLAIRFHGSFGTFEQHWSEFYRYLSAKGIRTDEFEAVSITYDSPHITPGGDFRHDCAIIDRGWNLKDALLQPADFRAGRYAHIRHRKPYALILETYATLVLDWLPNSGASLLFDPTGGYNFFRDQPWKNIGRTQDLDIVLQLV